MCQFSNQLVTSVLPETRITLDELNRAISRRTSSHLTVVGHRGDLLQQRQVCVTGRAHLVLQVTFGVGRTTVEVIAAAGRLHMIQSLVFFVASAAKLPTASIPQPPPSFHSTDAKSQYMELMLRRVFGCATISVFASLEVKCFQNIWSSPEVTRAGR